MPLTNTRDVNVAAKGTESSTIRRVAVCCSMDVGPDVMDSRVNGVTGGVVCNVSPGTTVLDQQSSQI